VWLFLKLSPLVLPFDMEAHLEAHYTKLDTQTRQYLQASMDYAAHAEVDAPALRELIGRGCLDAAGGLPQQPAPAAA